MSDNDIKDINCEEALSRLFEYIDHELSGHRHTEMEEHLSKCRSCFSRLEFEKRLKSHLQDATKSRAPADLELRIKGLIRKL